MVTVHISETYDLATKINKMTLIGIHTPTRDLLKRTYPGLAMNHKFVHIDSVSVRLAAVSTLPVSPDQVGADADDIAPEDMLNPILYKAVTNESWSTLEARLNGLRAGGATSHIIGNMVDYTPDQVTGIANEFEVYYALLSNRSGFKIAHPQQGLSMNKLVPLVFDKYYSNGQVEYTNDASGYEDDATAITADQTAPAGAKLVQSPMYVMRGRPHKLPRLNTTVITNAKDSALGTNVHDIGFKEDGIDYLPGNSQAQMVDLPPLYCGLILMPPARRTIMFYRLVVSAQITFSGVRPIQDIISFQSMNDNYGPYVYHSDYNNQSKAMSFKSDMLDVEGADVNKIMEG